MRTLVRRATDDIEAYSAYLKGRHFWNRRHEADLRKGLDFFQQALARDPNYALAHAGIADSYAILGFYCMMPPTEAFPAAKAAALRALEIDPTWPSRILRWRTARCITTGTGPKRSGNSALRSS